jgi:hypothetical protein
MTRSNRFQSASTYLMAGVVAGPFFIIVALIQAFTLEGFNWVRHPASMLSLGDAGWIQIANFVLSGVLFIMCGIGLRRALTTGIGSKWASRLFVLFGIALIIGGVFTADPGLGFPPGAPECPPKEMSMHGMIHGFAPILGFASQFAALNHLGAAVRITGLSRMEDVDHRCCGGDVCVSDHSQLHR